MAAPISHQLPTPLTSWCMFALLTIPSSRNMIRANRGRPFLSVSKTALTKRTSVTRQTWPQQAGRRGGQYGRDRLALPEKPAGFRADKSPDVLRLEIQRVWGVKQYRDDSEGYPWQCPGEKMCPFPDGAGFYRFDACDYAGRLPAGRIHLAKCVMRDMSWAFIVWFTFIAPSTFRLIGMTHRQ